ncbi:hypothetical protein BC834DRAFT_874686 [Gloeopeniophorella convolvens]|nr:hypothetical protein BC834DRAFT_874686 [Gloeopeniophorella convolvens]
MTCQICPDLFSQCAKCRPYATLTLTSLVEAVCRCPVAVFRIPAVQRLEDTDGG